MNEQSARQTQFTIIDRDGEQATMDASVAPPEGVEPNFVLVRFNDGESVFTDPSLFSMSTSAPDATLAFAGSFAEMRRDSKTLDAGANANQHTAQNLASSQPTATGEPKMIVPIIEEQLRIRRERIVTGGVRVHKTVTQHTEAVDQPVFQEQISVQHVPVNRVVERAPEVRHEGDTMIVPLLEEVIVVEKRLVLREEIHITKRTVEGRHQQEVVLRREDARLESVEPDQRIGNQNQS